MAECDFNNGISQGDFLRISDIIAKDYADMEITGVNPPIIRGFIKSGKKIYEFTLDYNDYGKLTGAYKAQTDCEDKSVLFNFADDVREEIEYGIAKYTAGCKKEYKKRRNRVYIYDEENLSQEVEQKIICPVCKSTLSNNSHKCPYCGFEINSVQIAASVKNFIAKVERCDEIIELQSEQKKGFAKWYANRSKNPALSQAEKNKSELICNYPFPNEKASVLDAIMFIQGRMTNIVNGNFSSDKAYFWFNMWYQKAQELRKKAEVLFVNDNEINSVMHDIEIMEKEAQKKRKLKYVLISAVVVIFIILLIFLL